MRFREFKPLLEFANQEQSTGDPASDLTYLITHTDISPKVKNMLSVALKNMVDNQGQSSQPEPTASEPVDQVPAQLDRPVVQKPDPEEEEPAELEPEDEYGQDINEARDVDSEEAELLTYIKNVKNKSELGKLLYVVRDGQFKKIASDIVKKKIKFKPRETYELIKTRIRALSTRVPVSVMTDFLNTCLESGIIDTIAMITGDNPTSEIPLIDTKYRRIADAFLDLNLERLGKGEIGLAFMGIDATKETSDISVAGIPIEVKASKGTDFFMKGNPDEGGFGYQTQAVKILVDGLNKAGGQFNPSNRSKQGGIAAIGRTNISVLNEYFGQMGKENTTKLLISVLKELNKKSPKIVDQYAGEIGNAVNSDGTVEYAALGLATAKINFDYYKLMSHHEGLLVLNLQSFQYVYMTDSETFASLVDDNVLQQMYAIDFRSNGLGGIAYIMNEIQSSI